MRILPDTKRSIANNNIPATTAISKFM
jgi:hypothetical protein